MGKAREKSAEEAMASALLAGGGRAVVLEGIALHAGVPARVRLQRATGPVAFVQRGARVELADLRVVRADRGLAVASGDGRVEVDLVEHLLAALGGLGVREGVAIETDDPELPLLDGGARAYVEALGAIGAPRGGPVGLRVARAAVIEEGRSRYTFAPAPGVSLRVDVRFRPPVGRETAEWHGDPDDFAARVAPARTFGWLDEHAALLAFGRARAVDTAAVIVFGRDGPLGTRPPEPGEVARHKLLDLIGDFALHGGPPEGAVEVVAPGHGATQRVVVRALRAGVLVRREA